MMWSRIRSPPLYVVRKIDKQKQQELEYREKLVAAGVPLAVNSDAHWPEKTNLGRDEALAEIENVRKRFSGVSLPPAVPSGE